MKRLLTFLRLPGSDRSVLTQIAVMLWAVRLGLWLLPYQTVRKLLGITGRKVSGKSRWELTEIEKITHGVQVMSRYVPGATCLTQALVTEKLLTRAGFSASLRIGVARGSAGQLDAHAWVESMGRVVIGDAHVDLSRYTVLHPVEGI